LSEVFLHSGESSGVNLGVEPELLGWREAGFALRARLSARGELVRAGRRLPLARCLEGGEAFEEDGALELPLEPGDNLSLELGPLTLRARLAPPPRRAITPWLERVDFRWANSLLATLMLAALVAITGLNRAEEGDDLDPVQDARAATLVRYMPPPPRLEVPTKAAARSGGGAAAPGAIPHPQKARARSASATSAHALDTVLLAHSALQTVVGVGSNSWQAALTGVRSGARVTGGDLTGLLSSSSTSGQDNGLATVGIGPIGTHRIGVGVDRAIGQALRRHGPAGPYALEDQPPRVDGSLDPELIRQVIRAHLAQIRYCYEVALGARPNLAGRLVVRFLISGRGGVASASVAESSLSYPEVEKCVVSRVLGWSFPEPKGGGQVLVSYPFVLQRSG
jgi:hypothetical protein